MTTTKILRRRKATITLTAFGEVLFAEGQDVPKWVTRFSRTMTKFAAEAAPSHNYGKRPLRPHDRGTTLKKSFTSTTEPSVARMRVDSAVGSRSPYALFVDQGTGMYNPEGGGPYEAKVLPPWREGEGSLYEATWTPGKRQVAPVIIKGQVGQRFMEKGLDRAFSVMMRRAGQLSGAEPKVGKAMALFPENLALRGAGNTPNDAAFRKNMEEWRSWRDEAFRRGDMLGRGQREGRTRAKYLEYRQAVRDSQSNIAESRRYSEERANNLARKLLDRYAREREGQRKREEKDRKVRTRDARAEAVKFARGLNQRGIASTGTFTTDPKTGKLAFAVTYRQGAVQKTKYFVV